MMSPSKSRIIHFVTRVVLVFLLVTIAWRATNEWGNYEPGPDTSMFMAMAWHANNGRVLYKDVWDHKPPMIFALNSAALALGDDGINSIHAMERVFALAGLAAFFVAVYLAFGSFWIACLTGFFYLFQFYEPHVFELGNVTEEYGAILSLVGIVAAIASRKWSGRRNLILCGISGALFSMAVLCKEPFILGVLPWFLYIAWPRHQKWSEARKCAGTFILGVAIPVLIFFGYLFAHGAWADWVDSVVYNFLNKAGAIPPDATPFLLRMVTKAFVKMHPLLIACVTAILGLASLLRWSFVRRNGCLPLVIVASALLSLLATTIGGGYSGHYYLFFVPSFALLSATGVAFVADLISHSRRWVGVALVALLGLFALDVSGLKDFTSLLAPPQKRWSGHVLSEVVLQNTSPRDLIWAPWMPLIYVESHRLSPTKWYFVLDHLFIDTPRSTAAEKFKKLRDDLALNPPQAIILDASPGTERTRVQADEFFAMSGLTNWIAENYRTVVVSRGKPLELLMWKGSVSGVDEHFFITDDNWTRGIANRWAGFFVPNTPQDRDSYKVGRFVKFRDGDERGIIQVAEVGEYLQVVVSGGLLDPKRVGIPTQFEVVDKTQ